MFSRKNTRNFLFNGKGGPKASHVFSLEKRERGRRSLGASGEGPISLPRESPAFLQGEVSEEVPLPLQNAGEEGSEKNPPPFSLRKERSSFRGKTVKKKGRPNFPFRSGGKAPFSRFHQRKKNGKRKKLPLSPSEKEEGRRKENSPAREKKTLEER